MNEDLQQTLKKIITFDLIITIIVLIATTFIFKSYRLIILLGLAISLINFVLNGIITEYSMNYKRDSFTFINFLGFVFRVIVVCGIALMLFQYNKFNVIAYMFGYTLQFVSLTVYGLNTKNN